MSVRTLQLCVYILVFFPIQVYSQITLSGKVEDEKEALPFVNISLFNQDDSICPVANVLTDITGSYRIPNLNEGKYFIRLSLMGYNDYFSKITLRMPSGNNILTRNFILTPNPTELNEVVVSANRNIVSADHTKYFFTDEQRSKARHSADLMESVGDLIIDPNTGNLQKFSGGNVTILVNGINASISDLKSIPSNKIRYVEYYTIPAAKYSNSSAVVNIITNSLDNGLNGGVDVSHAISTGFSNDNTFLRYTFGENQLTLNYRINYRNYKNKYTSNNHIYYLTNQQIEYQSNSYSKFGYTTHIPELKYLFSIPNKISFQVSFNPKLEYRFDKASYDIITNEHTRSYSGYGNKNQKSNYFGPSLDLYFSKTFKNNSELSSNIVATYYNNKLNSNIIEIFDTLNTSTYNDIMKRSSSKKSIIGEVFYSKKKGLNSFSIGYKGALSHSVAIGENLLTNSLPTKHSSNIISNYVYSELSGVINKLMYRISLGGIHIGTRTSEINHHKLYITPQLLLNWNVKGNSYILFNSKTSPITPTISQLSNNAESITSYLIHTGNPLLKSGTNYTNILAYKYNSNLLEFNIGATYNYASNPIDLTFSSTLINDREFILLKEENAKFLIQYGTIISGNLRLFSNNLNLRATNIILKQYIKGPNTTSNNLYSPINLYISFTQKNWGINYNYNIPSIFLSNSKFVSDENVSTLNGYFQYKHFRLTCGCYWFLTKAKYIEKTTLNNFIKQHNKSWINDNKSMIVIGFSWNFSKGKKVDFNKKLNNIDNDSGLF